MSTKTCKSCGWVFPSTQPGKKCLICGTPFDVIVCTICGKALPISEIVPGTCTCVECVRLRNNTLSLKSRHRRYERLDRRFDDWIAKVRRVPTKYPTLTEAQWLEACKHFNGCARCNSDEIDTRGFFIARSLGGRYCDWNIIPLCERCAKIWKLDKSVFTYAIKKDYRKNKSSSKFHGDGTTEYADNLEKIIEYLEVRLDNALRVSEDIDGNAE